MRRRDLLIGMPASLLPTATLADVPSRAIPVDYPLVWSDDFTKLSLRTGGPTEIGQSTGTGTWACPGAWYSSDPRGVAGYGYDWFVNPEDFQLDNQSQIALTKTGLRIRSEAPPPGMNKILPSVRGVVPWLSGQVTSYYAVRIRPPFYFEARAKMPVGIGRPWPAIWLMTQSEGHQQYEIDVHEGYGDSDHLHATIHWNPSATKKDYLAKSVVEMLVADLSKDFNTWGCHVTAERQTFYFNDQNVGSSVTPSNARADLPFGIILDVSAGIPWKGGGPPSDGPHDMIVRYVKFYAPDRRGLVLS